MPPKPPKPPPVRLSAQPAPALRLAAGHANPAKFSKSTRRLPPLPSRHDPSPSSHDQLPVRPVSTLVKWTSSCILLFCGTLWSRDHLIDCQHVRGLSMSPTLNPSAHETGEEDYVVVRAWRPGNILGSRGTVKTLERGDVITFWKPHKPEELSIKRIIATEGDTVYPQRGYALDPQLRKERLRGFPDGIPDVDEDAVSAGEEELGKVVVPYGHVWVEGDNWRNSYDSRDFGPISKGLVIGKATWIWRSWMQVIRVGDARDQRDKNRWSKVLEGEAEVPTRLLS